MVIYCGKIIKLKSIMNLPSVFHELASVYKRQKVISQRDSEVGKLVVFHPRASDLSKFVSSHLNLRMDGVESALVYKYILVHSNIFRSRLGLVK